MASNRTTPEKNGQNGSKRPARLQRVRGTLTEAEAVDSALQAGSDVWNLRLYIAGDSPKSRKALENLKRLCETYLPGAFQIEVVDLRKKPELAKTDQILAIPTLIRKIPEPMKRIIGDLSNADRALSALDLRHGTR